MFQKQFTLADRKKILGKLLSQYRAYAKEFHDELEWALRFLEEKHKRLQKRMEYLDDAFAAVMVAETSRDAKEVLRAFIESGSE